ncbi:MAG: C39 family peptidase [Oscillospiraceae bacterium]|nr:C39 family peptidase [Oscillospiraceae bacterium]
MTKPSDYIIVTLSLVAAERMEQMVKQTLSVFMVLLFTVLFASNVHMNGAAQIAETAVIVSEPAKIPYEGLSEIEGAAGVEREADVADSPYYKHPDFYSLTSTGTLTLLEGYKTIQQATEWTCGPTSALTVLEWYGKRGSMNEMDLVALRGKDEPGATNLRQMMNIFENLGGWDLYSTYDLEDPSYIEEGMILEFLGQGKPILLGWDDWGGHWQVIIGYDTMGTDTTADDVLILADPYDTTDHNQDGYYIISFERLYYNWSNRFDPDFDTNVFLVASPST